MNRALIHSDRSAGYGGEVKNYMRPCMMDEYIKSVNHGTVENKKDRG
jgi:hypothetical protein